MEMTLWILRFNSQRTINNRSTIESGYTPTTWIDFNRDCGSSRVLGGVHFPDAVGEDGKIGNEFGNCSDQFVGLILMKS